MQPRLVRWVGYVRTKTSQVLCCVYDRAMESTAGFVLAGGRSSRMGREKAYVDFQGMTLLGRALANVSAVTEHIAVVGPATRFSGEAAAVIEDRFPGAGPLAGSHAALAASTCELNLILAVDLPLVSPDMLRFLLSRAESTQAMVTVPRIAGGWQPLCAVYRRAFCTIAENALLAGRNKIDSLYRPEIVLALEETELAAAGFPAAMFRNMNRPEDLTQVSEIPGTR